MFCNPHSPLAPTSPRSSGALAGVRGEVDHFALAKRSGEGQPQVRSLQFGHSPLQPLIPTFSRKNGEKEQTAVAACSVIRTRRGLHLSPLFRRLSRRAGRGRPLRPSRSGRVRGSHKFGHRSSVPARCSPSSQPSPRKNGEKERTEFVGRFVIHQTCRKLPPLPVLAVP